eukprot:08757.XXX_243819_243427_1 [CDS] Oithona nana genome sequencing.
MIVICLILSLLFLEIKTYSNICLPGQKCGQTCCKGDEECKRYEAYVFICERQEDSSSSSSMNSIEGSAKPPQPITTRYCYGHEDCFQNELCYFFYGFRFGICVPRWYEGSEK